MRADVDHAVLCSMWCLLQTCQHPPPHHPTHNMGSCFSTHTLKIVMADPRMSRQPSRPFVPIALPPVPALVRTISEQLATATSVSRLEARAVLNEAGDDLNIARRMLLARRFPHNSSHKFQCCICIENEGPSCGVQLTECDHNVCAECLICYATSCFDDGKTSIQCPMLDCKQSLTQSEIRACLGERRAALLDRRALELTVSIDPTLHLCPSPDCTMVVAWIGPQDGPPKLNCSQCNKQHCLICRASPYHEGISCDQFKVQFSAIQSENERKSIEYLRDCHAQTCKRCGSGIIKDSGCDKVKCRCGYRFCYRCLTENAQCTCTSSSHGFIDNVTGGGDWSNLSDKVSPT